MSDSAYIQKIFYLEISPINDERFSNQLIDFLDGLTNIATRLLNHPIELCAFLVRPSQGAWPQARSETYFKKIEKFKQISEKMSEFGTESGLPNFGPIGEYQGKSITKQRLSSHSPD